MFEQISFAVIPVLIAVILIYATYKKVPVYEEFPNGAKQGFDVSVRIIPYLVAMMVAVAMFRASGAIDLLGMALKPVLEFIGMPIDLLPLALTRSLSGSGARGIFAEIAAAHGPDAPITKTAAVMLGCSETTFYVLAVYFGAVGVTKFRHAITAGIVADLAGIILALIISKMMFY
ncbi:MAG: spore maturation protein [Alphaproteobacteria bacterium]|nr:spore maturation protein [Alphaproteobacteria bacterium]